MKITEIAIKIFNESINNYHKLDNIDTKVENPYKDKNSIEHLFYIKNWIDTVQWHLEDIIREPSINPEEALKIKRRIDASNQERTDLVEFVDSWFLEKYKPITVKPSAKINTETLAWAFDRLSILSLKIFHMREQANRNNASDDHKNTCNSKLNILLEQEKDLSTGIEELITDIENGDKYIKTYKQMKMYNDPNLNPVLYKS